jgi:hypothetical protein
MPSEEAKSSLVIVLTHTKVESPLFGQYVGCETVISKKHSGNWLYVLKNETSKSFDEFESAINAMDAHLKAETHTASFFLPVLGSDSQTTDKVLLGVSGSPFLDEIFDTSTGLFKRSVEVWRMQSTVPPRKRAVIVDDSFTIPGIRRLNKQLRIDFTASVQENEGKRKREPTSSIYKEHTIRHKPKEIKFNRNTPKSMTKDETIKSLMESHQAALASRDILISAQAAVIATLNALYPAGF